MPFNHERHETKTLTNTTKKNHLFLRISWACCLSCVSWLAFVVSLAAQTAAPAPQWPQFRGSARLSGVTTAAPPATLALKWTYDAGEAVESSAAIVDGAVYVGSAKGELLALDLG